MINRRHLLSMAGAATLVPAVASAGLFGKDGPVFTRRGKAIRGIDPVAYFTQGGPVEGSKDITTEWMGGLWHFATAENREAFEMNPRAYAPQYGGYCAWAVSRNYTASTDPEAWRIVDGKLYLNFSKGVRRQWEEDIPGNISRGDANWPGILEGLRA